MSMKKINWILGVLSLTGLLFASDPRIEQGKIFAKAGEYDKAIAEFRAVLASNPDNALAAEAYFAAAEVYVKKTDYGRAMANYRLAYQKQPSMSAAYEGVAGIYELLGDKAQAEAERAKDPKNKVIEAPAIETPAEEPVVEAPKIEEPKEEKVVAAKAVTEEKAKEEKIESKPIVKETAKVEEQQVKETGFTYDGPSFTKGRQLFESKKYSEAAALWREVLRQQPGNPGAYYFAGAGRYELGELDKAEFNLKRAFDYPELGYNAHYYLSLIYKKQGKKSAEIEQLKEYIRLTPNASAKEKAKVRLDELEGKSLAKPEVKVEEKKPEEKETLKEPEKVAEPVVEAVKAETPKEEKVLTESVEKVEVVKEQKAKEEVAELPLSIESANALFKQKKLSEALSFYKELLEKGLQDEDRAFVLLQMGNIYRERRDFRLAVSKYREIVESFSESFWAAEAERAWKDAVWLETHISEIPRK
jgi:tetratricopeptide (TPR) repeat protein